MKFLAETDEEAAELQADMERSEFKARAIKDALIAHGDGGVGERTAKAGCDPKYTEAMELHFLAIAAFRAVQNKRQTEALVVDVWRSINSARSKGIM
jgi:hypothetical protein